MYAHHFYHFQPHIFTNHLKDTAIVYRSIDYCNSKLHYLGINICIPVQKYLHDIKMATVYSPMQRCPPFTICNQYQAEHVKGR